MALASWDSSCVLRAKSVCVLGGGGGVKVGSKKFVLSFIRSCLLVLPLF